MYLDESVIDPREGLWQAPHRGVAAVLWTLHLPSIGQSVHVGKWSCMVGAFSKCKKFLYLRLTFLPAVLLSAVRIKCSIFVAPWLQQRCPFPWWSLLKNAALPLGSRGRHWSPHVIANVQRTQACALLSFLSVFSPAALFPLLGHRAILQFIHLKNAV